MTELKPRPERLRRPAGIAAIAVFLALGSVIASTTEVALVFPGGPLESMWRLNPPARDGFRTMGRGAFFLMPIVSAWCAATAFGLSQRRTWGLWLAISLLTVNLIGDLGNAFLRGDMRTLIGIPIGGAMIAYLLSGRSRGWFRQGLQ